MAKLLALAVAALCALSQPCSGVTESVQNGIFASRSGDIVVTHATPVKGDALLIAIDSVHEDLTKSVQRPNMPEEMHETEIAPLVAHVLGATPMTASVPKQVAAFPSSTILRKPRANLLVAIPSLGSLAVEEQELPNLQALRQKNPSFVVSAAFEPRNALAELATMATGNLPSTHGVVGTQWRNPSSSESTEAYSALGSHAAVPTVADALTHTFPQSLAVSLSGDRQLASAASTHPASGANAFTFSVDPVTRVLQSSSTSKVEIPQATLDNNAIVRFVNKPHSVLSRFRQDGGVVSVEGNTVVVQPFKDAPEADTVRFDLSKSADFAFFSELAAVDFLVELVSSGQLNAFTNDGSPDLFTITLAGFENVAGMYGNSDKRTVIAAKVLDAAVPQLVKSLGVAYQSELTSQVVLMGSQTPLSEDLKQAVSNSLQGKFHKQMDVEKTFPSIYVEEDLTDADVTELCSRTNHAVSSHGFKAECISELTRPILLQAKSTMKDDGDSVSTDQVANYQINLWVSVILVLFLLGGLMPLMSIDPTEGTFSSFLYAKKYV